MYFKQILNERCGCASYLIASRQSREAVVVDPSTELAEYEALLKERDFTLRYVIDTHVHADHLSGARDLAARHGATLCLHRSAKVTYPFRGLADGEEIPLGQLRLRVLHTPGHRPELISILVVNPPRSPEPSMVLTGDSMLVGDVGRPDFGGGDAEAQYGSIKRLLDLPDYVSVFPGHFEGPCGKGMCGRPSTTIGFERRFSPILSYDQQRFVSALTTGIPPRPLNMTAIEATNRGVANLKGAMLTSSPEVPVVPVTSIITRPAGTVLLDVREPEEYVMGHVPGARNLPQADLASRLEELPRDQPLYVICQAGMRSLRCAQYLRQAGFENVTSVSGGTSGWAAAGHSLVTGEMPIKPVRFVETEWAHAGAGI
jgi:glyoxylase-like metal-dependent hydrolase (beta-lactamase superfamily II)/rhodanese-related sulfurtransferase